MVYWLYIRCTRRINVSITNKSKLFYFTMAVCLCDCLLPFLLACFYNGYDHRTMVISSLGSESSPARAVFNIWMICLGISFIVIGIAVFKNFRDTAFKSSLIFLVITITYATADCVVSGFFSVGDSKEMVTTAQKLHGYGSVIGCTLFTFAGLMCTFMLWRTNRRAAILTLVSFIFALITFVLFVSAENISEDATGFQKILSYEGMWQRISFVFAYLPYIFITSTIK